MWKILYYFWNNYFAIFWPFFLVVNVAETGDEKKGSGLMVIGLFLLFCSFFSIIVLTKISIIFFLLLLAGGTIAWAATQYDKKTENKKQNRKQTKQNTNVKTNTNTQHKTTKQKTHNKKQTTKT